ncbi:MAG: hypothetical protein LBH00_09715, partial [Planctomycetaceae bacterium]|nr:hypothetical protein [Planctomycetaceae bacterium]
MPPYVEMEAICPAGRRYVVARKYKDSSPILPDTLFLFDAEQGRVVGYFEDTPQEEMSWYRFAFSPDGTRLAGCRWNSNYCVNVRIWDTATGKKSADF